MVQTHGRNEGGGKQSSHADGSSRDHFPHLLVFFQRFEDYRWKEGKETLDQDRQKNRKSWKEVMKRERVV